jgi:hypothetical protein
VVTNETANIPLSNGSNIMYFCSLFVKYPYQMDLQEVGGGGEDWIELSGSIKMRGIS